MNIDEYLKESNDEIAIEEAKTNAQKSFGQIAYEAYHKSYMGLSSHSKPVPNGAAPWIVLSCTYQDHWHAVASTIIEEFKNNELQM